MTIEVPHKALRKPSRRHFLFTGAGALGVMAMPYLSRAADRPQISHGVQSGDVGADGGVVWARADRPSQMLVEVATSESFRNARVLPPIAAVPDSDFTAKILLENLPAGQDIFYRIRFRDLSHINIVGEPAVGRFRTAPADRRDVSFVWGGDVAGQGWGINPDDGGMRTFATMHKHRPDFLIHSGDTIYADGVFSPEVRLPDGKIWNNVMIAEKEKVAETLDEFRAAHKYNFLDHNVRAFNAARCRSSCNGTTMRSPTTGRRRSSSLPPTASATSRCSPPEPPVRFTRCIRYGTASMSRAGSIAP
jgi:alkaline phosphatase D